VRPAGFPYSEKRLDASQKDAIQQRPRMPQRGVGIIEDARLPVVNGPLDVDRLGLREQILQCVTYARGE
jgi:hypothetical protein